MHNREAAKHITDTLLAVTTTLKESVKFIEELKFKGKVSSKEASQYHQSVADALTKLHNVKLNNLFGLHPDLKHECPCCGNASEKEKH
ncbi:MULTISPECIES: hypothetical protein [Pantoea]|uniref:hypothetical protein n=1 Tax=Pantoea TaxID=53335 RepID=UPI0004984F18|nr:MULTISPECIES: hypothetical protein [Pantoea]MCS3401347.1 hypothetical protein [Pantoea sp. B566]